MTVYLQQQKKNLLTQLHASLHNRMAASSGVILATLFSANVVASQQIWMSGSAFEPSQKIQHDGLPSPSHGNTASDAWLQSGEMTDAKGNPITSVDQFKQLIGGDDKSKILEINQKSGKLILNWDSFDVAKNNEVKFNQPATTSLALNKINSGIAPTYILGRLTSNGGVYLINQNGILFGKDSQVNVGSLTASTLNVDEQLFLEKPIGDILRDNDKAAFFNKGNAATNEVLKFDKFDKKDGHLDVYKANDIPLEKGEPALRGDIAIQAGAKIHSTTLNGVVAVAPTVVNEGEIKSPDGQIVLAAAKDEAFVLFSNDPSLRGLLVEVKTGGSAQNLGEMIAERGNITLAGLAVNNNGHLKATTSVDFNGTIRLIARDNAQSTGSSGIDNVNKISALVDPKLNNVGQENSNHLRVSTHGGEVDLGTKSLVEVTPELTSKKSAPDAQVQALSGVEISANKIHLEENAVISAQGGQVFLDAITNLSGAYVGQDFQYPVASESQAGTSQIILDKGSKIDVSGTQAQLSADRNVVEIELRGSELADSPLQRDGFLKGKKVSVDVRKGTPLADISPALATIPKQIDERLMTGGTIRLRSQGEVIVQPNASLDVSGGGAHYAAGYEHTSNLISEGKVVNIGDANPTWTYSGILGDVTAKNKRFNLTETFNNFFIDTDQGAFVNSYDQGASAGSISLQSQAAFFQGNVKGDTFSGVNQRVGSTQPKGGNFSLELKASQDVIISPVDVNPFDTSSSLLEPNPVTSANENPELLSAQALLLPQTLFNQSGLSRYSIQARNGSVEIAKTTSLVVVDGADLSFSAAQHIDMNGSIKDTGGNVTFKTSKSKDDFSKDTNYAIHLGSAATINTSGNWINDNPLLLTNQQQPSSRILSNAGAVTLSAKGDLLLDKGSSITANGGGWIDRTGKLTAGKGGDISLSGIRENAEIISGKNAARIQLDATLSSYAFEQGGKLSVTSPSIRISNPITKPLSNVTLLSGDFFQQGGFSSFALTASASNDWVSTLILGDSGTTANPVAIAPHQWNYAKGVDNASLESTTNLMNLASGSDLVKSLGLVVLPDYLRKPVNLSFTLNDKSDVSLHPDGVRLNNLTVSNLVKIETDPKATVSFTANNNSIIFDGVIHAPGSQINLTASSFKDSQPSDFANFDDVGILLGTNSLIDVSSTFIKSPPTADGLTLIGKIIDAGAVNLTTTRGFLIAKQGSQIDLSASAYKIEKMVANVDVGSHRVQQLVGANAGSLNLVAAEGVLWDGTLTAKSAGNGALGSSFSLELNPNNRSLPRNADANDPTNPFNHFDFSTIHFGDSQIVLRQTFDQDTLLSGSVSIANFGRKDGISDELNGVASFSVDQLVGAGFDAYNFTALNPSDTRATGIGKIVFEGNSALVAGKSVKLNATTFEFSPLAGDTTNRLSRALVIAPYLQVGLSQGSLNGNGVIYTPSTIANGKGELFFGATQLHALNPETNAQLVDISHQLLGESTTDVLTSFNAPSAGGLLDLVGQAAVSGADKVTLASGGDLRTNGLLVGGGQGDNARYLGSFAVPKDLTLQAAQIYPSTLSEFIFSSGQRDFSAKGVIANPDSVSANLTTLGAFSFDFEYHDLDTGALTSSSQFTTWNEAYDILAGKLGVGDAIRRVVTHEVNGKSESVVVTGSIAKITDGAITGSNAGTISILSGSESNSVLSAGGRLVFDAPIIHQSGTLKAPFGWIAFNSRTTSAQASGNVVIGTDSLTSVSAENTTIPFGQLDSTDSLVFKTNPKDASFGQRLFTQNPEAKVFIKSANIDLQKNATIDLSGGGDLQTYRFVPGPGGSKDVLASENAGQSFAILPASKADYAPRDPSTDGFNHAPGESIYLSADVAGVPAGQYVLLPASYALLPGAYLVTPVNDGKVYNAGQLVRRIDGTSVVAGRFELANTDQHDSFLSGFVVEPGAIARTRSEYIVTTASQLFKSPEGGHLISPNDAAGLSLLASRSININADIVSKIKDKGIGGQLDISSDQLRIVDALRPGTQSDNVLDILAPQLMNSGFDSVLLGGHRSRAKDGTLIIKADAQRVEVASNTHLSMPTILLAAKGTAKEDGTSLTPGAVIVGEGAQLTGTASESSVNDKNHSSENVDFFGDSLLRISSARQVDVNQFSTTLGNLTIEKNALLTTNKGSELFLTNGNTLLNGSLAMQGGSLNIGSGKVNIGEVKSGVDGLSFTNDALAQLQVDELFLTSASTIDFYGNAQLNFDRLQLKSQAIRGFGDAANAAHITAKSSLTLNGGSAIYGGEMSLGKGTLTISSNQLFLGAGDLSLSGFSNVNLEGKSAVIGKLTGKLHVFGNDQLQIQSPLLTGMGASNTQMTSDGAVKLEQLIADANASAIQFSGLGSRLSVSGRALDISANIRLSSGQLDLKATGNKSENVTVHKGAVIDVSGQSVVFDQQHVASPGGAVRIESATGNIAVEQGSLVRVSGVEGAQGSDAGTLRLTALNGEALLAGNTDAKHGNRNQGAGIFLQVETLSDFSTLLNQIRQSDFSQAVNVRVGKGDLFVDAGQTIRAHQVSLSADSGNILVSGTVDASSQQMDEKAAGGNISLQAKNNLTLSDSAKLLANSSTGKGGEIALSAGTGFIDFANNTRLDVSGINENTGGKVTLRAPRTLVGIILPEPETPFDQTMDVGNDVAIRLSGTTHLLDIVLGASAVDVDAVKVYSLLTSTSEIFQTTLEGASTLTQANALLSYRMSIPFGATCANDAGCTVIHPTESNGQVLKTTLVQVGDTLPIGNLCGDLNGCNYSYELNNDSKSIANVETKSFMQFAPAIENRLFGQFSLVDRYHLKPELELRSAGDLTVDNAIDFGKGLGVLQQNQDDGSYYVAADNEESIWRFNDDVVTEKSVFNPDTFSLESLDRYTHGEAGVLTLRAGGDLHVSAPVSDGFAQAFSISLFNATGFDIKTATRSELSNELRSWTINLISGADMHSADINTRVKNTGDIQIDEGIFVRTGTGNLQIASGRDLVLNPNAAIYTAGRATDKGFFDELTFADPESIFDSFDYYIMSNVSYGVDGGSIHVDTGRDITALGSQQFVTDWLQRAGSNDVSKTPLKGVFDGVLPTTWAVSVDDFKQGIATLGGGNIDVTSVGDVNNVSIFLPTTGKNTTHLVTDPLTGIKVPVGATTKDSILVQGGGDLSLAAGGNILSGQFFIARGKADINAGGEITAAPQKTDTLVEVADGKVALSAAGNITLGSILNPTSARVSAQQTGTQVLTLSGIENILITPENSSYFYSYADSSSTSLTSLSGDIQFTGNATIEKNTAPYVLALGSSDRVNDVTVYTPQLQARALQGSIQVDEAVINLFPSEQGQLALLSAKNILSNNTLAPAFINVSDADVRSLPSVTDTKAAVPNQDLFTVTDKNNANNIQQLHAPKPVHLGDLDPIQILASTGDISNLRVITPKETHVTAGRDITDVIFEFQNVNRQNISLVNAGRDIRFATPRNPLTNNLALDSAGGIDIAGFGGLDVIAGGDVKLGASRGVQSIGAQHNASLLKFGFGDESGADINVIAGIKGPIEYQAFAKQYFGVFKSVSDASTTTQLIDALMHLTKDRASTDRFIKTISGITHRDYYNGVKAQDVTEQDATNALQLATQDLEQLEPLVQQKIAYRVMSSRDDNYIGDLIAYVSSEKFGSSHLASKDLLNLSIEEQYQLAFKAFQAAPTEKQRQFVFDAYFNEIRQGGIQDVSGKISDKSIDGFVRSYNAIESLFPKSSDPEMAKALYSGNISLIFSTIQTQQGGNVNLLAPGGSIDVGVAAVGGGVSKDSSKLGLIALRNGNINAVVNNNINVNSSRVFSLDGGDIMLWSSYGNLDAGRGAKTALSVPPPIINSDGSINFQAAVAGSGIRNSRFTQNRSPGAVYLFAPAGVVNAGDAGIGSEGDVLIAAQQVIGADNIDVGGISIGIPVSTGVSAGVASAGSSTTAATDSNGKDSLTSLSESLDKPNAAFVTVDILGFDF